MSTSISISSEPAEVAERIEGLDLDCIKVKLMDPEEGRGWSLEQADEAGKWYKRYLFFCVKYRDLPLVPLGDIDHFWHQHILDTRKYAADCEHVFGYFLHHFPYFGMRGDDDAAALSSAGDEMLRLFEEEYGETPFDAVCKCHSCKKCSACFFDGPNCKKDCQQRCKNVSGVDAESRPQLVR